jgi:hypothetical protein
MDDILKKLYGILDALLRAQEAENEVLRQLAAFRASGDADEGVLNRLMSEMETARQATAAVYERWRHEAMRASSG